MKEMRRLADVQKVLNEKNETVNIANNTIVNEGAFVLAKELSSPTCFITTLQLHWAGLGEEGGVAIGEALETNSSLTILSLGYRDFIGITRNNATDHQYMLEQIKRVKIRGGGEAFNTIMKEGGKAIGKALKQNRSLTILDLCVNNIGYEGAKAIAEGLASLLYIWITILLGRKEAGY